MALPPFKGFGTDAVHAGQQPDPISGAVMTPISLASTFYQKSPGAHTGYEYARTGNPTRNAFEANVAAIENGKFGAAFASGLGATASLMHLLNSGDEVIAHLDMYGGTGRYFNRVCNPHSGITFKLIDMRDISQLENAISEKSKLVWLETPTNPTMTVLDIQALADTAHRINPNIIVVVDNTFMSPYFQRPLDLGADIVMHSVSKYINGHSDVIMGVVALNNEELFKRIKFIQNGMGAIPGPFDSYMAMRGIKTLHLRMDRHQQNALQIARYLEAHPKVAKVLYPGLESHPEYEIAKRQCTGFGGMITIWLKGGLDESRRFLESVRLWLLAESLGGVESLIEHPAIMTHASVPLEQRKILGIDDSLVRLSVGVEDVEDLLADLTQALEKV